MNQKLHHQRGFKWSLELFETLRGGGVNRYFFTVVILCQLRSLIKSEYEMYKKKIILLLKRMRPPFFL